MQKGIIYGAFEGRFWEALSRAWPYTQTPLYTQSWLLQPVAAPPGPDANRRRQPALQGPTLRGVWREGVAG